MVTQIEIENSLKVISMLSEIEEIEVEQEGDDLFKITEPDSSLVLYIDVEETTIVFLMDICSIEKISEELGTYLLTVNNDSAVHGAFGFNPELKKIIFKNTLEIENLDLNELQSCIISMFFTVFNSISGINERIGG